MPALFQQMMDAMMTALTGTTAFINDIIIASETPDVLLNHLFSAFEQIQQYGFHLQAEKCQFFRMSIRYS